MDKTGSLRRSPVGTVRSASLLDRDAAPAGSLGLACPGRYSESVTVTKGIGNGRDGIRIEASGNTGNRIDVDGLCGRHG